MSRTANFIGLLLAALALACSGGAAPTDARPGGTTAAAGEALVAVGGTPVEGGLRFTATVASSVAARRVEFVLHGSVVGTATSKPWTMVYEGLVSGSYELSATAYDAAGTAYPAPRVILHAPQLIVGNPGFEVGTASWTGTAGVIQENLVDAFRGAGFARFRGKGTPGTDTLSQRVTLPPGAAVLAFALRVDAASSTITPYDTLDVTITDEAGTSTRLARFTNADYSRAAYAQRTYDLSRWAGKAVTLGFTATEDDQHFTGFLVDEVSIRAAQPNDLTPPRLACALSLDPATGYLTLQGTADDPSGVVNPRFVVDGQPVPAPAGALSATVRAWNYGNARHTFALTVADGSGNEASCTLPFDGGVADTVPPQVTAGVEGAQGTIRLFGKAIDLNDDPLDGMVLYVDGVQRATAYAGRVEISFTTDATTLGAGTHLLTVTAVDGAGNLGSASHTFEVEGPSADATPPAVNASNDVAGSTATVTATATDASGIVSVQFFVGTESTPRTIDTEPPYQASMDISGWAVGNTRVTVRAVDGAGNVGSTYTTVSRPSNIAPYVYLSPTQTADEKKAFQVTVYASDPERTAMTYAWSQVDGPAVVLAGASSATVSFTTPDVAVDTAITLRVTVTDGGGRSSSTTTTITVVPGPAPGAPTAEAGPTQTVNEGAAVTLAGAGTDPGGAVEGYLWTQLSGPTVALENATSATATFVAPAVTADTSLVFRLTVSDDLGLTGRDTVEVHVLDVKQPPVAAAGDDRTVDEETQVSLAGSGADPDGDLASYTWEQVSGPPVALAGATTATPSFRAPSIGAAESPVRVRFRLTVTDATGSSARDEVELAVLNVNKPPVANAGADKSPNERAAVTLTGTGTDPDGTIARYAWTQTGGPTVALTGADTATLSFTAPEVTATTDLVFQLTVTDDGGRSASDTVIVRVWNVNALPTASAGADLTVDEQTPVSLTGGGTDGDGTVTRYAWTQTSGTSVTLTGAGTATPSFTAPAVTADGVLVFRLTVTDNDGGTAQDTVQVTVRNVIRRPTAEAGPDQTVASGATVRLSGAASTDPDGTIAAYGWAQVGGAAVALAGASTATPSFTAPTVTADTVLTFQLTVTDDDGAAGSDTVRVTVQKPNQPPTVSAGADQRADEGAAVTLTGTAADADGAIAAYAWTQTGGPAATLSGADTATLSFVAPAVSATTRLSFQLTVTDDRGATAADAVEVEVANVNVPPTANAGTDQSVDEGAPVTLTGSGSRDPDGVVARWEWAQTGGPAVALTGAGTATPTFTAPEVAADTTLAFRLTVTDADGAAATADVQVTVRNVNKLPTVEAGADRTANEGTAVSLTGTAADADGTIAAWAWTQVDGPTVTLAGADTATVSFTAPAVAGDAVLTLRLTVTDDGGASRSDTVRVTVANVNQLPTADAGGDVVVDEGTPVQLAGSGTDPDGTIVGYAWTRLLGPAVTPSGADTATLTFVAPAVADTEELVFRLTVTDDGGGTATADVRVTVRHVNRPPAADAGDDLTVEEGASVALAASGSDPDGVILSYAWRQTSGPQVALAGASGAAASFTAPAVDGATVLTFEVTATDDAGATATDTVQVTVVNANQPPVADAGPDQLVNERYTVRLSGSGADPDGTVAGYAWTQVSGPAISLTGANRADASFVAPSMGPGEVVVIELRLTVTDDRGATGSDTVQVTVRNNNQPPTVDAGADQTVYEGQPVTLSGAAADPDGTVAAYAWTQDSGATVALTGADQALASFTAPQVAADTVLVFQLLVTDDEGATFADTVRVTVRDVPVAGNQPPTAAAGQDQTVDEGTSVTLAGSGADTDGTIAGHAWTQIGGPEVALAGAATATASFTTPAVQADTLLTFRLTVTDDRGATATDTVQVTVRDVPLPGNEPPIAAAGADRTVDEGTTVTLAGSGTDSDGTIAGYAWAQVGGPEVALAGAATAAASFTAPAVEADTLLTFRLTVTDDDGAAASDTVQITVQARADGGGVGGATGGCNTGGGGGSMLGLLAVLAGLGRLRRRE